MVFGGGWRVRGAGRFGFLPLLRWDLWFGFCVLAVPGVFVVAARPG
ncbi:hypothetical protein K788_0007773 [Paraburkholderia caribensis MBA4]|uniref:Uncharacterized protein n=1 Tax=Paraburkholderia caribensis MBA4 TaxID=1323664 RepID=A0A0P0R721_9BURK|nr:hypothetical protein K788_0007773 [Paraburkholderia caribensis MBA4]